MPLLHGRERQNRLTGSLSRLAIVPLLVLGVLIAMPAGAGQTRDLIVAAYSVPKEAYEQRLIPAFKQRWKERTGQELRIRTSYGASGAQARAIMAGFEADIAALSVEGDMDQIAKAGLITHDWRQEPHHGNVSASVVALGVRKGNPKDIRTWKDLAKPGVEVLYPNPKTSGGAMWDVMAIYGAAIVDVPANGASAESAATSLLKSIQRNVKVMDKSGRESVTTFERGVGDVIITYENELLPRVKSGRPMEVILPASTLLIQNPATVVDRYADKHQVRDVAEAFIAFLHSEDAQRAFVDFQFRPVTPESVPGASFPQPAKLFTIGEIGGWDKVAARLFGPQGLWSTIIQEVARGQ